MKNGDSFVLSNTELLVFKAPCCGPTQIDSIYELFGYLREYNGFLTEC